MFDPESYPITIVETRSVQKELDSVLSEQDLSQMIDFLAINPDAGDIVSGTNGVRKMRWSYGSKGKRSGLRVLYYFRDLNMPIYVLAVYKKNEKINITPREKEMISKMVEELVDEWACKRQVYATAIA